MRNRSHRGRVGPGPLAATAAALALVLAGCGSGDGGDDGGEFSGELTLLTPIYEGSDGQRLLEEEILPAFYEQYPDLKVSVDYTTYGNLNEKLTTAVASGLVPDLMMMGVGWVEAFAANGVLANLTELGVTTESLNEVYNPAIVQGGVVDGSVYALPVMLDTRFGCVRSDILADAGYDEPPSNLEELREYARELTVRNDDGTLERAGFDMLSMDLRQMYEVFLFANGGSLFTEDLSAPAFNSPEGVEALQFLVDLIHTDRVEDIGFSSTDAEVHPLLNGRAAMGVCHNNLWVSLQEAAPELADQIQPFLITGTQPGMFFGGTLVTVSANSDKQEAALALAQHLTSAEASLLANEQRGNVPARTDLLDSDYVQSNPLVQFAMENLQYAQREGGPPQWLEIRGDFAPAVEAALLGEKSAQQALDDLAAAATEAMSR
ncbi:MAG TPA: ABC transporter substrate-binding protein [Natronosporangium sp.]